jgi:parvulin-like peptidyl-prolyl isomerase
MQAKAADFPSPLSGDLGLIPVTDLPDSVRAEVAELPIGALSRPMMNAKGIFVLMVCERPEPTPAAAPVNAERNDEAAREQIANTLGMQKLETLQQRYLRDLRSAAFIDRRI